MCASLCTACLDIVLRKLARGGILLPMSTQEWYEHIPVFTVGDRLRKAREWKGLDQGELAEITGISRGTVSHLELGKAPLKRSYLNLWVMATGVPAEWLESGIAPQPDGPGGGRYGIRDSNPEPADLKDSRSGLRLHAA